MNLRIFIPALAAAGILSSCATARHEPMPAKPDQEEMPSFYLPNTETSRTVSVTKTGPAAMSILIQTHRAAVNETGPKETIARFGEVYSFSPNFIAVHRDEPTRIRFWNLQPDDQHAFMLLDPKMNVLINVLLPPVQETSFVFTFHKEGLFYFYCSKHQPSMNGQILVLPPAAP
jgi:plastocyanin